MVRLLNGLIRSKFLHGLLVLTPGLEQGPRHRKVSGERPRQEDLLRHRRHPRPRTKHVSDIVFMEKFKVLGLKKLRVANLHRVTKHSGQRAQHRFDRGKKLMRRFEHRFGKSPKLKNQDGDPVAVWLEQVEKFRLQQGCIQEVGVHHACPAAIAGMAREGSDRNLLRHFKGEAQSPRSRRKQLPPKLGTWELIEGKVAAYDGERLRIFGQAFALKTLLRKTSANKVALRRVDLPQPSFVLPGTCSEVDPLLREWRQF